MNKYNIIVIEHRKTPCLSHGGEAKTKTKNKKGESEGADESYNLLWAYAPNDIKLHHNVPPRKDSKKPCPIAEQAFKIWGLGRHSESIYSSCEDKILWVNSPYSERLHDTGED